MTDDTRRQFLGVLATGAVASTGLSQTASAGETPVVAMGNNYFDPIGLHVETGSTVRFDLEAGSHSATAYPERVPDGATAFDSGTISQGSFEHTFETSGTYDYYCIPHKTVGMVGRIVVGSPGGPAEDSPIPDGEVPASDAIVDEGTVAHGSTTDGSGNAGGGMMGPGGHGMGNGRPGGAIWGLPLIGGVLGLLGAVLWAFGRGDSSTAGDDPAMATLRSRYERGDIDEAEFERRRERLGTAGERLRE